MKPFSRVAIATLTMVGAAAAQPAPAPAPAPAKDAKPATPAPTPTPAKDAKPPAPTPTPAPAKDAKPAAPVTDSKMAPKPAAPPVSTDKPQPPPEPPLPPEIEAMAKTAVGTWKCKGDEFDEKGNKVGPITATNKVKLELDNWWLSETMEIKGLRTVKMMAFSTYDPRSKKWRRAVVMNRGGQMIGTSDGQKESKLTWNMDLISPQGGALYRDYQDASDPKVGLKVWGEYSIDKGKNWLRAYEMTCKK
jgi:hypothetical protein